MAIAPRKRRKSSPKTPPRRSRPGYDPRATRDLTRGAAALHLYLTATRGTASRIAKLLDVTEMTVSFWHRGKRVPAPKMRVALARETRGAVAVEVKHAALSLEQVLDQRKRAFGAIGVADRDRVTAI